MLRCSVSRYVRAYQSRAQTYFNDERFFDNEKKWPWGLDYSSS